ncbi:MAG: hypothetical protein AAF840_04940 [Bacteroidota bacterium]
MLSTLRKLLTNNPLRQMAPPDRKILAICLGAAFVFWLILNLSRDYDISRDIAVSYQVDPERVLVGRMPAQIEAKVSGNGWNLIWESLRPGDLPIEIDVTTRQNPRITSSELERKINRKLSSGKLSASLPGFESIPILTTPQEGKRVPIVNKVAVDFAPGYFSPAGPSITPDSITVNGATDALEEIDSWPTTDLQLEQVNNSIIARSVTLLYPEEGITLSREKVSFDLPVEAFIQEKITVPVTIDNAPRLHKIEYSPKEVTIRVSLPQSAYGSLRAEDFLLVADLSGDNGSTASNTVPLTLRRKPKVALGVLFEPGVVEYYLVD